MTEEKSKIIKAIVISGILLPILCLGIYYRLSHKIDNYTKEDIQIIKGTLKHKPEFHRSAKGSGSLKFELNEYENSVYSLGGIFLDPVNYVSFISDNEINDSIQISVLKTEDYGMSPEVLEIKTARGEYLTLKALNECLARERPLQSLAIYSITIIVFFVLIWKIIKLKKLMKDD